MQKALLEVENNRFRAMIEKDTARLATLLADDLVYIHSDGHIDSKSSFIKNIMTGTISYLSILPENVNIMIDTGYAWIYGRARIKLLVGDNHQPVDIYVSYLDLYRSKHRQWQQVAWQSARLDKK